MRKTWNPYYHGRRVSYNALLNCIRFENISYDAVTRDNHTYPMISNLLKYALILSAAIPAVTIAQTLNFSGNTLKVLEVTPEKSTGLNNLYVLYSAEGVSVSYTSTSGNKITWQKYGYLGGAHAEEIHSSQSGNTSTVSSLEGNMGYIVIDGDRSYYFWITEYKPYRLSLRSAEANPEQECGVTILNVDGSGEPIRYYTINGVQKTLDRQITIKYQTQEWNDSESMPNFVNVEQTASFENFQSEYRIYPPNYCASKFTVAGDRFLRDWNWEATVESPTIQPHSVDARTFAKGMNEGNESEDTTGSNLIGEDETDGLGGSAPCDIAFTAYVTDGVIHHEWQLTEDPTFETIDYRFTSQDLDYTFLDDGTHYLRYIGSNSDGSCEIVSDIYQVSIGESQLLVPNAFSPNGDGVNDEWKVAYRSILEFNCWIFDRQGHEICHLSSPEQGWNGKIGGKDVESGVFFYVIEATGADGKKYKKSGDINVVKYVGVSSSN